MCVFEDNRQCEEWALIHQNCPTWGLKITGYETDAQVFCAITGGKLSMESSPIMCTLPANQWECSADDYFTKWVSCVVKQ